MTDLKPWSIRSADDNQMTEAMVADLKADEGRAGSEAAERSVRFPFILSAPLDTRDTGDCP